MRLAVVVPVVPVALGIGLVVTGHATPDRVRLLVRRSPPPGRRRRPPVSVLAGLIGRPVPDATARRIAWLAVAVVAAVTVHPVVGVGVVMVALVAPFLKHRRARRAQEVALLDGLPDAIDLLVLATSAGTNVREALDLVIAQGSGPVMVVLRDARSDVDRGARLADALEAGAPQLEPHGRPLVAALVASERYGEPLGPALTVVGRDLRTRRQRSAEEAARRLPVKLIFPLVFCNLPAFALLTLVPLLAGSIRGLR
jgi:Flp pilus assembly protein TadB